MKRRQFIRLGSYGAAGAAVAGGLTTDWYGQYGNPIADPGTDGDRVGTRLAERERIERQNQISAYFTGAAVQTTTTSAPPPAMPMGGGAKKKKAGGC